MNDCGTLWYARSAEFLQHETLHLVRWLRVVASETRVLPGLPQDWR